MLGIRSARLAEPYAGGDQRGQPGAVLFRERRRVTPVRSDAAARCCSEVANRTSRATRSSPSAAALIRTVRSSPTSAPV